MRDLLLAEQLKRLRESSLTEALEWIAPTGPEIDLASARISKPGNFGMPDVSSLLACMDKTERSNPGIVKRAIAKCETDQDRVNFFRAGNYLRNVLMMVLMLRALKERSSKS